jgi:hypothetical protein
MVLKFDGFRDNEGGFGLWTMRRLGGRRIR